MPCKIAGFLSNDENDPYYFNQNQLLDQKDIKRNDSEVSLPIEFRPLSIMQNSPDYRNAIKYIKSRKLFLLFNQSRIYPYNSLTAVFLVFPYTKYNFHTKTLFEL